MGWFRKKTDPLSERERALNAEIAALESQIQALHRRPSPGPPPAPSQGAKSGLSVPPAGKTAGARREWALDVRDSEKSSAWVRGDEALPPPVQLEVRAQAPRSLWQRWLAFVRPPPEHNPKLVSYLAAGSLKGLRPLRYEKRVARNRFIAMFLVLVLILWGLIAAFWS